MKNYQPKIISNIESLSTDYIGSKRMLEGFLTKNIIYHLKFDSVIDAFSGSSFVSHLFKRFCKEVHSNDFFDYPHITSKALIENNERFAQNTIFGEADLNHKLNKLLSVPLKTTKIQEVYGQRFYTEEENNFFELIRHGSHIDSNILVCWYIFPCPLPSPDIIIYSLQYVVNDCSVGKGR